MRDTREWGPTVAKLTQDELERLVDKVGLYDLLGMLGEIATGKAAHIAECWQPLTAGDRQAVKDWNTAGRALDRVKETRAIRALT